MRALDRPDTDCLGAGAFMGYFKCKACGVHAQYMYRATYSPEEGWRGALEDYGPLQLAPSAQVWHARCA